MGIAAIKQFISKECYLNKTDNQGSVVGIVKQGDKHGIAFEITRTTNKSYRVGEKIFLTYASGFVLTLMHK